MKAVIYTLGCKINQCESDSLAAILQSNGYEISNHLEPAELYIVNTCAVTAEAERKSRQTLTKIKKMNADAQIAVVGCSSQHMPEIFRADKNVHYVGGTADKFRLVEDLLSGQKSNDYHALPTEYHEYPSPAHFKTREYIKIQEGCNRFCTYCIVPHLRGRSRSRALDDILKQVNTTHAKEIVLTGIDLSAYGQDCGSSLATLLTKLKHSRIRLGSLEPNIVTEELLDIFRAPRFCKHFHLSMQNGSDDVLKKMNRHYTSQLFLQKVSLIRSYFPDANITTDYIAGFPTETDTQHMESLETVRAAKFGDMHVFPYSVRSGTVAASMQQVPKQTRLARAKEVSALRDDIKSEYLRAVVGTTEVVLTEQTEDDYVTGYSSHYIKTYLPSGTPTNEFCKVRFTEAYRDGMKASIVNAIEDR